MSRIAIHPHRIAFGRMLLVWRKLNGWTQYTVCNWANEAGFDAISYGNISVIEQGKAGELRHKAFLQIAEVNRRIHNRDWGAVTSQDLKGLLEHALPIGDEACPCWGPVELWACYIGQRPIPPRLQVELPDHSQGAVGQGPKALREQLLSQKLVVKANVDAVVALAVFHLMPNKPARRTQSKKPS